MTATPPCTSGQMQCQGSGFVAVAETEATELLGQPVAEQIE